MNRDDPITFDGITQPITEWALDYGIPADLIIARLAEGQTVEAAITTMMPFDAAPAKRDPRAKLYAHAGETLTIKEWARRTGVPRPTITQRLARGIPIAEAINPDLNRRNSTYSHNGETKTLAEWAAASGITYATMRYRVNKLGMSIGDALAMRPYAKPAKRSKPSKRKQNRRPANETPPIIIHVAGITITITTDRGGGLQFVRVERDRRGEGDARDSRNRFF